MKSTRILLLCGASLVVVSLSGCFATLANTSMKAVSTLTGADDPNKKGLLATAGRWQNAGTAAVAGAVGVKTDPALVPVPPELPAAAPTK